MAGDVSAGVLAGTIELDDQFTSRVDRIVEGVERIEGRLGGMAEHGSEGFLKLTAAFFSGEAALHAVEKAAELAWEALKQSTEALVVEGSKVADIESAYEHLAEGAHLSYDAIATLSEGMHGQISNLELMKLENRDLAASMVLSKDQMASLTQGAYALAQATGDDVTTALNTVNDALLTGRTRSIQILVGKIDLTKAEDDFGKKVGLTSGQLSEAGKIEAARTAILEKMAMVSDKLGVSTDDLHNRYERVKIAVENFVNKLEMTVANSPVIGAAFDAISKAITGMVDADQQQRVDAFAAKIDELMVTTAGFAETSVSGAKLVITAWYEVQNVYHHVIEGIQAITYVAENGLLGFMKVMNVMPGSMHAFDSEIRELSKDTDRLYDSMAKNEHAVEANRKAEESWTPTLNALQGGVKTVHDRMELLRQEHEKTAEAARKNAESHDKAAESIADVGPAADYARHSLEMERAEISAAAGQWKQYDEIKIKDGGSAVAIQKQQAKDWMDDQLQKLDFTTKGWVTHYHAIMAMGQDMIDKAGVDLAKLHQGSRQAMQDAFDGTEATYNYAVQHANLYSQEYLQILRRDREKALDDLRSYGHASVGTLQKVEDKADDVAQHILDITYKSTMLLEDLTRAEFESMGGQARLDQIEALYKQFPGRRMGGSGATGVNSTIDYNLMIQEQVDYLKLLKASKMFRGLDQATTTATMSAGFLPASEQPVSLSPFMVGGSGGFGGLTTLEGGGANASNIIFNIDGSKDPKVVADEVLRILKNRATWNRQFSAPGR